MDSYTDRIEQYAHAISKQHHSIGFLQVIYPATAKHVAKYESQPMHLIHETPALFRTVTEPYLQRERFDIEWVYNVLEHKKEAESIVFENPDPEEGFIMVPDYKWNGKQGGSPIDKFGLCFCLDKSL